MMNFDIDLDSILENIKGVTVGVVGDFCLDAYQFIDMSASESSIETGRPTRPVRDFRFSLGGAGNVAANLKALGAGDASSGGGVYVFGVTGDDVYGREMRLLLKQWGIDADNLLIQQGDWDTHVYTKLYDDGEELERVDFGVFNSLHETTCSDLLDAVRAAAPSLDALIINQQLIRGIHTDEFRAGLSRIVRDNPGTIYITDSRHFNDSFPETIRKLNDREAAALCFPGDDGVRFEEKETAAAMAKQLFRRWGRPVFLTRGDRGCLVYSGEGEAEIPGLHITSRIDIVGAGDSMLAGLTAALAAGAPPKSAALFGNFTAGVTVQKLHQTGTATPDEIRAIGAEPDFRYNPEKAAYARGAEYLRRPDCGDRTDIEVIEPPPDYGRGKASGGQGYAIFDHDGTISVLRQGWEAVMEETMMRVILDKHFDSVSEKEYRSVNRVVREFIDKTTGIQTLSQMRSLVSLVKEFGYAEEVSDEFGYKAVYNQRLMGMVNERIGKINTGERDVADFTIKKAVEFLKVLRSRGFTLFLASGTDQADVEREAGLLGYADLFNGGIVGAIGKAEHEPKRVVIRQILKRIETSGTKASGIVTFGDGPVELRETRKCGGTAVGVASDEIRRYGFNEAKRERLVLAGAHLIIPDFSQMDTLLAYLFGGV